MSDVAAILAVLQFGDSLFPSGAVSFSWGLEGLADNGVVTSAEDVRAFVIGQLNARWSEFDRPVVVAAHRAVSDLEAIAAIDDQVEIQTPSAELRSASRRMGEALLSVAARLGIAGAARYRGRVKEGAAHGHLAPMQGLIWGRAGLSEADAVALSAHTFCTGLLGAGIRLGCLTHIDAQQALIDARQEAGRIAALPVPPLTELSNYGVEAEIAVMQHANNTTRVFAN
jgi:urease accessory protein